MRYPRLLIVLFVAFGLAVSPAVVARADHTGTRSGEPAYAGTVFSIVDQAAFDVDSIRRRDVVELFAGSTQLDAGGAGQVLDAIAELVLALADTGQRAGVLAISEVNQLIAEVLAPSTDADMPAAAVDLSEPWSEDGDVKADPEASSIDLMGERIDRAAADPVDRWRPLIERYFPEELIADALSIIACESNGDPSITNPRSSAAGLFQFISGTWEHASEQAGFGGSSPFDPEANVAAAAWLVSNSLETGRSAWAHWTCRP